MGAAANGVSKYSETHLLCESCGMTMHTAGISKTTSDLRDMHLIEQKRSSPG